MNNQASHLMPSWKFLLILFVEGFASVSFQIITMRQLTPYVGSSVEPIGLVIGMFLASLSLGYWRGGKVSDNENIPKIIKSNFLKAAAFICVGFSTYSLKLTLSGLGYESFMSALPYLSVMLLIFMCPPVYFMAKTVPMLSNCVDSTHTGEAAGKSMSLSTVGSVLGSVITSLILFLYIGVSASIWVVILLLTLMAILCDFKSKTTYFFAVALITLSTYLNIFVVKDYAIKETAYSTYSVEEKHSIFRETKSLIINNQNASALIAGEEPSPYISRARDILFNDLGYTDSDVLVLGAGGFTLSYNDPTTNRYTYVDIDPEIKKIAEEKFLNKPIRGDFIAQDARQFLRTNSKKYDVIFVDLYTHIISMPWHVSTSEFMSLLKNNVKDDGVVIFNIISNTMFRGKHSKSMYKTIQSVFPFCYVDSSLIRNKAKVSNVIFSCSPDSDEDIGIYGDDKAFDPKY